MGEGGQKVIKWLMLAFNLLFWVSGIGLIIAGALAQNQYKPYLSWLNDSYVAAPVLLIVVGAIIAIIAFFGCCGSAKENYCMLMTFAVLLGIIFVVELAGGIAAYVERGKVDAYMERNMNASLSNYSANYSDTRTLWDSTQKKTSFKDGCCGVDSYQDWLKQPAFNETWNNITSLANVPRSCCISPNETETNCDRRNLALQCDVSGKSVCPIYTVGCRPIIAKLLTDSIGYIGGVGVGVAFIQLIGIVFACYLARRIRSGYSYN